MAAAFHHLQRGNLQGTASLLAKALWRLDRQEACLLGLQLEPMREEIRGWLAVLHGTDIPCERDFPQIRLGG